MDGGLQELTPDPKRADPATTNSSTKSRPKKCPGATATYPTTLEDLASWVSANKHHPWVPLAKPCRSSQRADPGTASSSVAAKAGKSANLAARTKT